MKQSILNVYAFNLNYARALVKDVTPQQWSAQPAVEGHIIPNHAAWVIGHLATSSDAGLTVLGGEVQSPAGWDELFGISSEPLADGDRYPDKATLLAALEQSHARLAEAFEHADDAALARENPWEGLRRMFPTVGDLCTFMLTSHETTHLGQLSAWRRAMGLGSVFG